MASKSSVPPERKERQLPLNKWDPTTVTTVVHRSSPVVGLQVEVRLDRLSPSTFAFYPGVPSLHPFNERNSKLQTVHISVSGICWNCISEEFDRCSQSLTKKNDTVSRVLREFDDTVSDGN